MKIKITKNTMPLSWYKDRIGETFNVVKVNNDQRHYIVHVGRLLESFIRFEDCEILNEGIRENCEKSFCQFTVETSVFCSVLPDCKVCHLQPKNDFLE